MTYAFDLDGSQYLEDGSCNELSDIISWGKSEENLMLVFSQRSIGYLNLKTRQFNILRVNARGGNLAVMAAFGQVSYLSGIEGRHFVIYDRQNNFTLCQRVEEGEDGKPAILEKALLAANNVPGHVDTQIRGDFFAEL